MNSMKISVGILAVSIGSVATASVPFVTNEASVAFWPITEAPCGTIYTDSEPKYNICEHDLPFQSVAIRSGISYGYRKIRCRTYGDGYVQVTNDVPGKYLFSDGITSIPMCDEYQSLHCVNWSEVEGKGNPSIWIQNFGVEIQKRTAWTFEYFIKNITASGVATYFSLSTNEDDRALVELPRSSNTKAVRISAKTATLTTSENMASLTFDRPLTGDGRWHHVALVYSQPNAEEDGDLMLYVDYVPMPNAIKVKRISTGGQTEFRIRNSIGDGLICAPRFTECVLGVDGFMRASDDPCGSSHRKVGFWSMDDQPVGWHYDVSTYSSISGDNTAYTNRIADIAYRSSNRRITLMAKSSTEGVSVTACSSQASVPGRYIYESARATKPIWEPKSSLFFEGGRAKFSESAAEFTTINVDGAALDMCLLPEWTFEWFMKFDQLPKGTFMYFYLAKTSSGDEQNSQIQVGPNGSHANWLWCGNTVGGNENIVYSNVDNAFNDGLWHHYAFVFKDGKLSIYADYTLHTVQEHAVYRSPTASQNELRFGQGNVRGWLSCIRMTAKALESRDFMYASDREGGVMGTDGWLWTLDGTNGIACVSAKPFAYPETGSSQFLYAKEIGLDLMPYGEGTATYAEALFNGRRIIASEDKGRNRGAVSFATAGLQSGETSPLVQLGRTFTVEAGVQVSAPASGTRRLFGAKTASGEDAWRLALDSSGQLILVVRMEDGTEVSRTVPGAAISGKAVHLAVSADILSRQYAVYVDRQLRLSIDENIFTTPLAFGYGLDVGDLAFTGVVDELRVSRSAITEGDFEQFVEPGVYLIFR